MGGQHFDVEPADLHRGASRIGTAGWELQRALDTLTSTLAGLGDYLGSDEQGQTFKAAYDPKVAEAERSVGEMASGLRETQPALSRAADRYLGDDRGVARGMDRQVRP